MRNKNKEQQSVSMRKDLKRKARKLAIKKGWSISLIVNEALDRFLGGYSDED